MAYFDAKILPTPKKSYVCFMDIMGMQNKMKSSLPQSSNYIFKLHATILKFWRSSAYQSISVYPIMDGAYIVSSKKSDILSLLTNIYKSLCTNLLKEPEYKHWYLVRAAIAFGEIIHGRDVPYSASYEYSSRVGYKEQLLIGPAMIDACKGESKAAPMGIYVTDSATNKYQGVDSDWKWFEHQSVKVKPELIAEFKDKLQEYYNVWLKDHEAATGYDKSRRDSHFQMAVQYFDI